MTTVESDITARHLLFLWLNKHFMTFMVNDAEGVLRK